MKKKIIIDGQVTKYSVTDDGKVFNDITGRELKGTYSTNEYHSIQLTIDGKPRTFMFHRLVAEAFCDNPNNYTIVDHIDRNKYNNNASNLRWVTLKENANNRENPSIKRKNEKYFGDFTEGVWTKVYEHEDYMINTEGVVVNTKTNNILKGHERNGYYRVSISDKLYSLHVLVWESFNKRKTSKGEQIDHIDGNKGNNCLNNLRLVDQSNNMKNAYANGHKGQVPVKQYSLEGEYLNTYSSIREAANAVGAHEAGLKDATNRHGTCKGYYWIRENDTMTIDEIINNWIPAGYKILKEYPTYCINAEGEVYNKRSKGNAPIKYRSNGDPYVTINGKRINIEILLNENF